jgi:hypothetical protein
MIGSAEINPSSTSVDLTAVLADKGALNAAP